MKQKLAAHFREQAQYCALFGSPFTAALIEAMADDLAAGGPVDAVAGDWRGSPRADAVSLRLAGALHFAALSGRDPALAALYPAANPAWIAEQVWPAARRFLKQERDWVRAFMLSPPQTNETRRSIALLAAFLGFAQTARQPLDMLELGASAGLNLNWDRFAYRTQSWSWGRDSPVCLDTDWAGPAPPLDAPLEVRSRAGCDLNPLDIRDPARVLQLKAYIWADQADRLARFDGAVALALAHDTRVERADAADWIARKLDARAPGATVVYHSVFLQYPPRESREAIVAAIEAAGAAAAPDAPLAWVRLEPEALIDGVRDSPRMVLDCIAWPGRERRVLGYTDGHVRSVAAL